MKTKAVGCISKGTEHESVEIEAMAWAKLYLSQSYQGKKGKRFYWAEKLLYNIMMRSGCYRYLGNFLRKRALQIIPSLRGTSIS